MPRRYFYDADQPNRSAPALIYPGPEIARRIEDDWTVWAFADPHGMLIGLKTALTEAGLVDGNGRWIAPPETALVGVGDYIDRGPDSAGVVGLLRQLSVEAELAGGRVVLARGNHEHMLGDILRGDPEWQVSWLTHGGKALLASFGLEDPPYDQPLTVVLRQRAPTLLDWLLSSLPYVRWRDVLFVHAAPIAGGRLRDLDEGDLQLWAPEAFLRGRGLLEPKYAGYLEDGIARVVVGHVPQVGGPRLAHGGATLLLDTDACGLLRSEATRRTAFVCLARIAPTGDLGDSTFVLVDTA